MVGTPTTTPAFERLAFNPQCFIINEDTTTPPSLWKHVGIVQLATPDPQGVTLSDIIPLNYYPNVSTIITVPPTHPPTHTHTHTTHFQVSISFRRNQAVLGSSLYMSNVDSCSWFSLTHPFFDDSYIKQWPIWDFGSLLLYYYYIYVLH